MWNSPGYSLPSADAKPLGDKLLRQCCPLVMWMTLTLLTFLFASHQASAQRFTGFLYSDLYVWTADSTDVVQPYLGLR